MIIDDLVKPIVNQINIYRGGYFLILCIPWPTKSVFFFVTATHIFWRKKRLKGEVYNLQCFIFFHGQKSCKKWSTAIPHFSMAKKVAKKYPWPWKIHGTFRFCAVGGQFLQSSGMWNTPSTARWATVQLATSGIPLGWVYFHGKIRTSNGWGAWMTGVPPWLRNLPDFFIWKPWLIFVRNGFTFHEGIMVSWMMVHDASLLYETQFHGMMKPSGMGSWWNHQQVALFAGELITNRLAVMMSSGVNEKLVNGNFIMKYKALTIKNHHTNMEIWLSFRAEEFFILLPCTTIGDT